MLRRNWGLVAATIFTLIVFSFGLGAWISFPPAEPYPDCRKSKSTNYSYSDPDYSPAYRPPDLAGVPGSIEALIANPEPCHGEDNEKRDLAAQEATAAWAFWMVALTAVQAIIGALGIFFVLRSLHMSREANEITKAAMVAEQRAWIRIDYDARQRVTVNRIGDRLYTNVRATLVNIGRSVALNVRVIGRVCAFSYKDTQNDEPSVWKSPLEDIVRFQRSFYLFPEQRREFPVNCSVPSIEKMLSECWPDEDDKPQFVGMRLSILVLYKIITDPLDAPERRTELIVDLRNPGPLTAESYSTSAIPSLSGEPGIT